MEFTYGADFQRKYCAFKYNNDLSIERYYSGSFEKQIIHLLGGQTDYLHYVSGLNGLAVIVDRVNGGNNFYYTYTDNLGSILTVTDNTGHVVQEQNFDAWGNYRDPLTWQPVDLPSLPIWLYRGFTGRSYLSAFRLINMNGRIYDPLLGSMLTPDMDAQFPINTPSASRYLVVNYI